MIHQCRTVSPFLLAAVCFTLCSAPVTAQGEFLAADSANDAWRIVAGSNQAVFMPDQERPTPQIVLEREAFVDAPVTLIVETDARKIKFTSGDVSFSMRIRRDRRNALKLDAAPDSAAVLLRNRDVASVKGAWLRICADDDLDSFAIHFPKATYANITFPKPKIAVDAPLGGVAPDAEGHDPSGDAAKVVPATEMLQRVKRGVFQVRARSSDRQVFATGTGFLLDGNGRAVTSFHLIQGASGADANFEGSPGRFAIELVAVRPDLDLALIRVDVATAGAPGSFEPLPVEPDLPAEGEEVWAVGFPKQLGYSVTRGVVNGVRPYGKLPGRLRRSLNYAASSVWIQTDSTINSGNSGGPLVNASGRVVGINTWIWREGSNLFFALSARHVRELLESAEAEPLTFAAAREKYRQARVARGTFPLIEIDADKDPRALTAAANGFRRAANCSTCRGRGFVTERVRAETRDTGTGVKKPGELIARKQPCPTCNGLKISDGEKINLLGGKVVESLAKVDDRRAGYDSSIRYAKHVLREVMEENSAGLRTLLNPEAMKTISAETDRIGAAVLAVGRLVRDVRMPGEGKRFKIITFDTEAQTVVVSDAKFIETTGRGPVLVGGLLAGFLDNQQGMVVPVLQHGFVISQPAVQKVEPTGRRARDRS